MHSEVARKQAMDLVLKRTLGEMAKEVSACMSRGSRCGTITGLVYWDYCDRCKADHLLGILFPEEKTSVS